MKKLAITGITGKNGRILLEYLTENQDTILQRWSGIRFLVRDKKRAFFLSDAADKIPFELVEGDLRSEISAENLLEGCDTVLHISGIVYSPNILHAGIKAGTKRFILVHTAGVYSKYKEAGESYRKIDTYTKKIAEQYNLELTILRPMMIYGSMRDHNLSVFVDMVNRLKVVPVISGGRYPVQPVSCRDLGKAFYQVLMNPETCKNKEYVLSGDRAVTIKELLTMIAKELSVKRYFISCPYGIAFAGARLLYFISGKKRDYREKVQRMCESRAYAHEDASADFGYHPIPLEEGIKEEVALYRQTGLLK